MTKRYSKELERKPVARRFQWKNRPDSTKIRHGARTGREETSYQGTFPRNLSVRRADVSTRASLVLAMNGEHTAADEWTARRKATIVHCCQRVRERARERNEERKRWTGNKGLLEDPAGRRGTGDIEPNALNKASVMELMTGCVPLALVVSFSARFASFCVARRPDPASSRLVRRKRRTIN